MPPVLHPLRQAIDLLPAAPAPSITAFEKRALQLAVVVAATLPVAAGAWGVWTASGALANHQRYLSGLLLAIGLGFWSTLPAIEHHASRFRLLTALVVIGGLCRLAGVVMGDAPSVATMIALDMELAVTPLLCLWQSRLGARSGAQDSRSRRSKSASTASTSVRRCVSPAPSPPANSPRI